MPSPIGHVLAGYAIASSAERLPLHLEKPVLRALLFACIALAVLPDLDLIYLPIHRTATHSLVATAFVTIIAAAVTGWVTGRVDWRVAIFCGLAHLSHIGLDWMGQDVSRPPGIQVLWPFSDRWFISGWDVFRASERHRPLSVPTIIHNLRTAAQEVLIFAPIILAPRFVRRFRAGRAGRAGGEVHWEDRAGKAID